MMSETQTKKDFDTVAFFRNIKEQIANKLIDKSFDEQKAVLNKIQTGEIKLKTLNKKKKGMNS